ncbi:MAG: tetratricopeptide repeat protein [Candidatus Omnitrophota bacterium]|jgi:tetratricopeptide (TPR) repeat protein
MSIFKIDKIIIAAIIVIIAYFSFRLVIPALADKPPMDMALMEEFISGKISPEKARETADNIRSEIQKNPGNETNYAALAFVCDYSGSYKDAVEALKSEIKFAPENSQWDIIYGNLAREYLNLGETDEIKKPALKSLKFNPSNINSHLNLLKYYVLKGEYKEAAKELKIVAELDKEMDFYYEIYTCCYDKVKNKAGLIELFQEAVNIDPKNPLSHRALGTAIRDFSREDMEKNLSLVMESFRKALELNENHIPTYISVANTYLYLGFHTNKKEYFRDSLVWINKAHRLDPRNLKVAYSMGNIFLAMEEYDKGIEKLEYAFNNGANDEDTVTLLAAAYNNEAYACYESGKDIKKGLRLVDKAIALDPDNGLILSTKAELLYKAKRFEEAYAHIRRAAELAPDEPGIAEEMAFMEKAVKQK